MREIVEQLGRAPDRLFVAVSTTGTIGGCVRYLQQAGAETQVTAVDADGSVLFGGRRGERKLPGFGAGVVPDLASLTSVTDVVRVTAGDTVCGARALARREGILPGASGGAAVSYTHLTLPTKRIV